MTENLNLPDACVLARRLFEGVFEKSVNDIAVRVEIDSFNLFGDWIDAIDIHAQIRFLGRDIALDCFPVGLSAYGGDDDDEGDEGDGTQPCLSPFLIEPCSLDEMADDLSDFFSEMKDVDGTSLSRERFAELCRRLGVADSAGFLELCADTATEAVRALLPQEEFSRFWEFRNEFHELANPTMNFPL